MAAAREGEVGPQPISEPACKQVDARVCAHMCVYVCAWCVCVTHVREEASCVSKLLLLPACVQRGPQALRSWVAENGASGPSSGWEAVAPPPLLSSLRACPFPRELWRNMAPSVIWEGCSCVLAGEWRASPSRGGLWSRPPAPESSYPWWGNTKHLLVLVCLWLEFPWKPLLQEAQAHESFSTIIIFKNLAACFLARIQICFHGNWTRNCQ